MNDWLRNEISKATQQLEDNPRLRLGVLSIPLIMLLYLNLLISDERAAQHNSTSELRQELLDARQLAEQDEWLERHTQARSRLNQQAKQHFGRAESEALARADIQANSQSLLAQQQLQQIRIEVSTAGQPDAVTQLIPLQLRLSGNAQGEQLFNLITQLENASPSYRIDSLNVNNQLNSHLVFSLIASVWYEPWSAP